MAFPPKLVAEQLTSIDAVSSGASRPGPGQACFLPSSAQNLPFRDVGLCGRAQISAPSLTNHKALSRASNPCSHCPPAHCGARPWEGLTQSPCVA